MAKSLAIAFKEGVKLLSEILRDHPNLLENLDDALTEEATERIDKKIAQEKSRTEEAEPAKSALEESEHVEAQASNNLSNNFDKTKKVVYPVVNFGKAQSALAKQALPKSTNRV